MDTIIMLHEILMDHSKKFENEDGGRAEFLRGGLFYINACGQERPFVIDDYKLNMRWKEVREPKPATWQEAFEAGMSGKRIKPCGQHLTFKQYETLDYVFRYLSDRPRYYTKIMSDHWYIEDGEEC